MELLKELSEAIAPSSMEDAVRNILVREFKKYDLEVKVDDNGNVIAYRNLSSKPILISAHMDEIGIIVKSIEEEYLRITGLGGYDPFYLLSRDVVIYGKEPIEGTIHIEYKDKYEDKIKFKDLFVQTDLSEKELKEVIFPGSVGGVKQQFRKGKYIYGKALDDRVGVYILTELAKDLPENVILMGSTEEEVSHIGKGAMMASWNIEPKLFIALDVSEVDDYPGGKKTANLFDGPEITVAEIRGVGNVIKRKYLEKIWEIKLPIQYRITENSATEASNTFNIKGGIPSIAICTPIRYIHTFNEMTRFENINQTIELTKILLEKLIK